MGKVESDVRMLANKLISHVTKISELRSKVKILEGEVEKINVGIGKAKPEDPTTLLGIFDLGIKYIRDATDTDAPWSQAEIDVMREKLEEE